MNEGSNNASVERRGKSVLLWCVCNTARAVWRAARSTNETRQGDMAQASTSAYVGQKGTAEGRTAQVSRARRGGRAKKCARTRSCHRVGGRESESERARARERARERERLDPNQVGAHTVQLMYRYKKKRIFDQPLEYLDWGVTGAWNISNLR